MASLLGNVDRDFGTVGLGEPCLVFKALGHGAVADLVRVAEIIEFEQLGRQRFAAGVALTLLLIDTYLEWSGHSAFPCWRAYGRALCFNGDYNGARMMRQSPHPEERPLGRVSKDGNRDGACGHPSRRRFAAPQDQAKGYFAGRGSIGVVPRTPRMSSSTLAPARSCASPRGAATICRPTGRPVAVKPHGNDSAGQHTSVIA